MPKVVPVSTYESPYCFTCKRRFSRSGFYRHLCDQQSKMDNGNSVYRKSKKPSCENEECSLCFPKIYHKYIYTYCKFCDWHGYVHNYKDHMLSTAHKNNVPADVLEPEFKPKSTEPRTKPKVRRSPKPTCENSECKLCFPKIYQKHTYAYCKLCNWHGITYGYNKHISSTGHKYMLKKREMESLNGDLGEGTEKGVGMELGCI